MLVGSNYGKGYLFRMLMPLKFEVPEGFGYQAGDSFAPPEKYLHCLRQFVSLSHNPLGRQ